MASVPNPTMKIFGINLRFTFILAGPGDSRNGILLSLLDPYIQYVVHYTPMVPLGTGMLFE